MLRSVNGKLQNQTNHHDRGPIVFEKENFLKSDPNTFFSKVAYKNLDLMIGAI